MSAQHNHAPACCCSTDTCVVCGGTDFAAPAVPCADTWHDEPPMVVEVCPACPDHGETRLIEPLNRRTT